MRVRPGVSVVPVVVVIGMGVRTWWVVLNYLGGDMAGRSVPHLLSPSTTDPG